MGLSEFFHIESNCEKCGEICHVEMQAKVPGSYMRDYKIGGRLSNEVLNAFRKGEDDYYSEVLHAEKDKVERRNNGLPSFTIVPDYATSYCKKCGRNDAKRLITIVIEKGMFTQVLYDGQRKGSIMHRGIVVPGPVLEDDRLRGELLEAVTEFCEGPSIGPETKPCPYCGNPLNPLAKQCFSCHMDWHDPNNVIKHIIDENKSVKKQGELNDEDGNKAIRKALGLDG